MNRSAFVTCVIVLASIALFLPAVHADPAAILDGGTGYVLTPVDVNNDGLVVGYGKLVKGSFYFSWAWREGRPMEIIGQIGGPGFVAPWWTVYDVNDAGQAVGTHRWWNAATERVDVAGFLWEEGVGVTHLPYPEGTNQCTAKAINNAGQVAGQCFDSTSDPAEPLAYLWNPDGEIVLLGHLGTPRSEPVDINESGQVLGRSYREGIYALSCFLWSPDTGMVDLGDLLNDYCYPIDLNDQGQVVAVGAMGGLGSQGAIWDTENGMQWIDPGPELRTFEPSGINNRGEVSGTLYDVHYNADAALWTAGGGVRYLAHPEDATKAVGINEAGQVLVWNTEGGKPGVWSPGKGLKNLQDIGKTTCRPTALSDNGHAVGSFTVTWNNDKFPEEYGVMLWKVKQ